MLGMDHNLIILVFLIYQNYWEHLFLQHNNSYFRDLVCSFPKMYK